MATTIYETANIRLIDGEELFLTPLKIKYLREFMEKFAGMGQITNDDDAIVLLCECATIAMKQYCPRIKTLEDLEDSIDLKTVYTILDIAAGIKMTQTEESEAEPVKSKAKESGSPWESLDLAKLESEVFLLGIWKDFEDLELSLSMPELMAVLEVKRESDYSDKKFSAAMQGVDLDEQSGKSNAWEDMKARVFSKGQATDANDVLALQGVNAQRAGFGIGMGLSYERID